MRSVGIFNQVVINEVRVITPSIVCNDCEIFVLFADQPFAEILLCVGSFENHLSFSTTFTRISFKLFFLFIVLVTYDTSRATIFTCRLRCNRIIFTFIANAVGYNKVRLVFTIYLCALKVIKNDKNCILNGIL